MSFDPEMVKEAIQEYYPDFKLEYDVDPIRQGIAIVGRILLLFTWRMGI